MKIAVLLSGGVDSSVALRLLKEEGHELSAFYLKVWLEDELAFVGGCPWEEDLRWARAVCEEAGVPLRVIPLQSEYLNTVVAYALRELRRGRTPSPDILCNQQIKFGLFFERLEAGFEKVASGHYARIERQRNTYLLRRAPDPVKDQTYFLARLNQRQLSRTLFPIGHLHKRQVRALARRFDLPNQERRDSQGICFLGKIHYRDFVAFHLGKNPGEILERETGEKLGAHQGLWFYTIGQRHGLHLSGGPWYVVGKDLETNRLYVSHRDHCRAQARRSFTAAHLHWIAGPPADSALQCRIRHGPELLDCRIESTAPDRLRVTLARPDCGIAAGQFAVFYAGRTCLGGGTIE